MQRHGSASFQISVSRLRQSPIRAQPPRAAAVRRSFDRRLPETFLCPHAGPRKGVISSARQSFASGQIFLGSGEGQTGLTPGCGSRFLYMERAWMPGQVVWFLPPQSSAVVSPVAWRGGWLRGPVPEVSIPRAGVGGDFFPLYPLGAWFILLALGACKACRASMAKGGPQIESRRLHGTPQAYLSYVVGEGFVTSPDVNSWLKGRP